MTDDTAKTASDDELRQRAERALDRKPAKRAASRDPAVKPDMARIVHELEIHRIELEMQNEELRAAQVALAHSRDRYYELYELAPVAHVTLDRRGRVREANQTAAELCGGDRADLMGRSFAAFMDEQHADVLHLHLRDVFSTGTKQGCDLVLSCGEPVRQVPVHLDSVACFGERVECRSAVIDLSDLRRAEREIRDGEGRFRQIAGHIEDVFVLHDRRAKRTIYASPSFETVWGRSVAELYAAGTSWLDWVYPDDRERVRKSYERYLEGESFDEEYRICRSDGEVRWVRCRATPVKQPDGQVRRDVAIIQDITSERELEEELRQAQKMEAVGALASGVAHDFNNVLQAILGCVNVARHHSAEPERAREYLEYAAGAARRGSELANQLMAFTRKQKAAPEPLQLDALLQSLVSMVERLVTEQVTVEIQLGAPNQAVMADAVQIEQILMNLAANARDAMPEGGSLHISTESIGCNAPDAKRHRVDNADCYVRLVVQDSGTGMDEQTRSRIFEPFFTTKDVGKGTGLGLSTVFAVTKQLGGHIDVTSEKDKGTTFALYFPCCEDSTPVASVESQPSTHFSGTALLVEDEALIRLTVRHYLERLGFDVLEAASADEAQRQCERHGGTVELLVSDVILPTMPGPKLAVRIKQRYPDVRVLLMSANPDLLVDGKMVAGGAPVLQKPFGERDLATQLVELFGGDVVASVPAATPAHAETARQQQVAADSARATILVVEDEPGARLALVDLLEEFGYRVLAARSPSHALDVAAECEQPIDVLLTDVLLPEMRGDELAKRLRSMYPQVRIIFMSGLPEAPDGAAAYVQKPIDLHVLVDVIKQTLSLAAP